MRLQTDKYAYKSADNLRRHILKNEGEAPQSLSNAEASRRWLGVAEIVTQYVPRTSAPANESKGMSLEQARRINYLFDGIHEALFERLDAMEMCGEREFGAEEVVDSFGYMEWCWFEPFYKAYDRTKGAVEDEDIP